jgi:D-cysteine desulfhydrase
MDLAQALQRFPREQLAITPTPLDVLDNLTAKLGPTVLLKREDLTGLALGGDKPRKLEYEIARARAAGADILITCGSMQSNHARLTSAAARKLGMDCAVVLSHDAYDDVQGNLLTVELFGAEIRVFEVDDHWGLEPHMADLAEELRAQGRNPHIIPVSGTTPHSCLGYVRAGLELAAQLRERDIGLDAVYAPFGTGGIFTSLLLALRANGVDCPAIAISVNENEAECWRSFVRWWTEVTGLLGVEEPPPYDGVEIYDEFVGQEYGDPTGECLEAITTLARTEGVLMDPVYTGKMCAGFLAHQAQGRWRDGHRVLMLHTGGVPALFAYRDAVTAHLAARE